MCDVFTHRMITLNENELEALRILWERGECKPAEVQEHFSREIDHGTLRSTLVSLVRKKHAKRTRRGKAFHYAARTPSTTALQGITRSLARIFTKGSMRDLVAHLVDTSDITPADLEAIRAAAAGKARRKP